MNPKLLLIFKYILCALYSICAVFVVMYHVIVSGIGVFHVCDRREVPPILRDKKFGEHKHVQLKRQGIKLHYVEKGNKRNPLMLFLHGFPECWLSWRHQIPEFASKYWVIALDMRGYGESEAPKGKKNYRVNLLVEDVREFVIEMGAPKTILVAHDWGAVIAWIAVTRYPELFTRHISINGPNSVVTTRIIASSLSQFMKSWYMFLFLCPFLPEVMFRLKDLSFYVEALRGCVTSVPGSKAFPDQVAEALKFYYSTPGAFTGPLNYYRAGFDHDWDSEDGKVTVPSLIIWGEEDKTLSIVIPKLMTALCEDVKYDPVPGTGHFAHEEQSEEVNRIIWNYLKL